MPAPYDEPGSSTSAHPPGSRGYLLVVDDEATLLESMVLILTMEGFEIDAVSNGSDALDAMQRRVPDLIILDLRMPGLSGWDVLDEMRADSALADVPVILLTAHSDEATRRRAAELEVADLLFKPADVPDILQAIDRALHR